jgi:hypothetical protein
MGKGGAWDIGRAWPRRGFYCLKVGGTEGWCFGERGYTYGGIHTCMELRRLRVVPAVVAFWTIEGTKSI